MLFSIFALKIHITYDVCVIVFFVPAAENGCFFIDLKIRSRFGFVCSFGASGREHMPFYNCLRKC